MAHITAKHLFNEIKDKYGIQYIKNKLELNLNTIKRWIKNDKVPENYLNDFNFLLNNKYKIINNYKEQDQYYTNNIITKYCFDKTIEVLTNLNIDSTNYIFVEPSAGCGNFFKLLPKDKRIGIDIDPRNNNELIKENYLNYSPKNSGKYIVVGNPPFGLRGNLALRFINHSNKFADVVAFILPPLFDSDGKGVPKKRVKGYKLAHTEKLPLNSFVYPNGKEVEVATIFQVWTKINTHLIEEEIRKTCKSYIKIYSLSDGGTPSSTRNKKMLYRCDAYLPSTCFGNMKCYDNFEDLPHRRGYGIIFLNEKIKLHNLFSQVISWEKVSFLSTNSAMNLRTSLIEKEIINRGFIDKNLFSHE